MEANPETIYDQRWAMLLLDSALAQMKIESKASEKPRSYDTLEGFLPGGRQRLSYEQAAENLDMSLSAVKTAIHRLRRRYRELLRRQVAQTVSDPSEIDPEIRHLIEVLGR